MYAAACDLDNERLQQTLYGMYFLHSGDGEIEVVKLLLKNNASVNWVNNKGETPLYWAATNSIKNQNNETYVEIVKLLIENGADVNKANNIASSAKQYGIVKLLLENNARNNEGETPLYAVAHDLGN